MGMLNSKFWSPSLGVVGAVVGLLFILSRSGPPFWGSDCVRLIKKCILFRIIISRHRKYQRILYLRSSFSTTAPWSTFLIRKMKLNI